MLFQIVSNLYNGVYHCLYFKKNFSKTKIKKDKKMEELTNKNAAQEILDLIIKIPYYDEFDGVLSDKAEKLIRDIKNSSYVVGLKSERSSGKSVLKWKSFIDEDLAFYVGKKGFCIDDVHVYKASSKSMKILFKDSTKAGSLENKMLVEHEVKTIKEMFIAYSEDIKNYFKKEIELEAK